MGGDSSDSSLRVQVDDEANHFIDFKHRKGDFHIITEVHAGECYSTFRNVQRCMLVVPISVAKSRS